MKAKRKAQGTPIGLGFRAMRGGAVVVGVAINGSEPRMVLSTFLATAAEGDRLAREPYHVATELANGARRGVAGEVAAAVAEGRRRQDSMAAAALAGLQRRLAESGYEPMIATLLVNRAGWITDLLEYSLSAPEHPAVAEGLAVREALRRALSPGGIRVIETDEKSVSSAAARELGVSSTVLGARLKQWGAGVKPWRQEQKLACLSAWLALRTFGEPARISPPTTHDG